MGEVNVAGAFTQGNCVRAAMLWQSTGLTATLRTLLHRNRGLVSKYPFLATTRQTVDPATAREDARLMISYWPTAIAKRVRDGSDRHVLGWRIEGGI